MSAETNGTNGQTPPPEVEQVIEDIQKATGGGQMPEELGRLDENEMALARGISMRSQNMVMRLGRISMQMADLEKQRQQCLQAIQSFNLEADELNVKILDRLGQDPKTPIMVLSNGTIVRAVQGAVPGQRASMT